MLYWFVVGENTVMTTAHALLATTEPISLFLFVPAYDTGNAPYGTFEMRDYQLPKAFLIETEEQKEIKNVSGLARMQPARYTFSAV